MPILGDSCHRQGFEHRQAYSLCGQRSDRLCTTDQRTADDPIRTNEYRTRRRMCLERYGHLAILLYKDGGGYRLFLDYFANLEPQTPLSPSPHTNPPGNQ